VVVNSTVGWVSGYGPSLNVPEMIRIRKDERKALSRLLEVLPYRWLKASDFVHEAIREKLHREGKRYSGP